MVYKGTVEEFDSRTMIEYGTMVENDVNTMICRKDEENNTGTVRIDYDEE